MIKIKDGFQGQRLVVFPFYVIDEALKNPLTGELAVHSMGYFPNAQYHYIERKSGTGEYILIYCTKGRGWYTLGGKRFEVEEDQFFILPPSEEHSYGSDEKRPWHIYWAHFTGRRAEYVYNQLRGIHTIRLSNNSRLNDRKALFDEMLNVMERFTDTDSVCYVNMSFSRLMASFLFVDVFRKAKFPEGKSENISFLSRVMHFLNENIENRLTIHDMAEYAGYSDSQFYRLFYSQTNYAPKTYFMSLKVNRACTLLTDSCLKVNQIAMKLGFDDPYYFSRFFKKMTGMSPKDYREKNFHF